MSMASLKGQSVWTSADKESSIFSQKYFVNRSLEKVLRFIDLPKYFFLFLHIAATEWIFQEDQSRKAATNLQSPALLLWARNDIIVILQSGQAFSSPLSKLQAFSHNCLWLESSC